MQQNHAEAVRTGTSVIPVEVVGLQSQLTVPSRHYPDLVDLWIEVNWPERTERWDEEFHSAAAAIEDTAPTASLSLQSLSPYRGWIVARGVPRDRDVHHTVESCVRAIVQEANAACASSHGVSAPPQQHPRWTVRTLSLLGSVAAIFSSQTQ